MSDELDKLSEIFLGDGIDEEDRKDNLEQIKNWRIELATAKAFSAWRDDDITRSIIRQIRASYKEISFILATNRNITEAQRMSNWAKQDALLMLLTICDKDARATIDQIESEIRTALNAVI